MPSSLKEIKSNLIDEGQHEDGGDLLHDDRPGVRVPT